MDWVFTLTLLVIFLSALIGTYIKRRMRDRCLEDFMGFHVTVAMKDGTWIWGRLLVFPNGIELLYVSPHRDPQGHQETSTLLFADQMANIQVIYRFRDELTDIQRERRREEIERTYHPSFWRRLRRRLRNLLNLFRDAFSQTIGVAVAQAKKTRPSATVLQTQDAALTQVGQTILGSVARAYEPMLERYIGHCVVAEEERDSVWIEHAGILKEYTANWLEILDCLLVLEHIFDLSEPAQLQVNRDLDFVVAVETRDSSRGLRIRIENRGEHAVRVVRLEGQDYQRAFDVGIEPGEEAEIVVEELPRVLFEAADSVHTGAVPLRADGGRAVVAPPLPRVRLVIVAPRRGDLCLPRSHAVVRHGGEILESWAESLREWGTFEPVLECARPEPPADTATRDEAC